MEKFDFHSLLIIDAHLLSPVGTALPRRKANARAVVPLLRSSYFLSMFTQGSISGFALIPPWAMQEYRPYRAPLRLSYHFIILILLPCLKENTPSMLVNK